VKIAVDMVKEKLIDRRPRSCAIQAERSEPTAAAQFDPARQEAAVLATGLPASPGAAVGKLAFTADEAVERAQAGRKGAAGPQGNQPGRRRRHARAAGILTSTGGMTSHAAVVARGWGRCCVAGAGAITINEKGRKITVAGKKFTRKDTLSIDGTTGEVMAGSVQTQTPKLSGDFAKLMVGG
jgi:pyruvate,orthophosphate dikinase